MKPLQKYTWHTVLDKSQLLLNYYSVHFVNGFFVCVCSVVSYSLRPPGTVARQILCPWNFPGKNTGVGCHFLLQGIFLTQGSNLHLLSLLNWQILQHCTHWEALSLILLQLNSLLLSHFMCVCCNHIYCCVILSIVIYKLLIASFEVIQR